MRLLLDESLPRPLADLLVGHDVRTVPQVGWARLGNGALLRQATAEFHAVLTADQNIEFQQNLKTLPIAVVADSNRLESLVPLVVFQGSTLPTKDPGAGRRLTFRAHARAA